MCCAPASFMAESTAIGIESLSAQEKSTISTESARVVLRVSSHIRPLPKSV